MNKILTVVLVVAACTHADDVTDDNLGNSRQKRLLFFDEGGSLVKTYSNPYMNNLADNAQRLPFYGNFLNPFFNFIRHFGENLITYTIPVSSAIIESMKRDPSLQNTLVVIPKKDPIVEPNPLCEGKRTQIPAPNLCNNFLNCWDGWAFEQECPTGLMFSSLGYCDYADNVDCHNRNLPVEKPQTQPVCNKDFEAFRNQLDCNEFFVCVNRQPIRFKCPADLAYSQILGVCDYRDRVDCKSSSSSISFAPPPYPAPIVNPSIPAYPSAAPSPASPISDSAVPPASGISASPVIPPSPPTFTPASATIPPASPVIPPSPVIPSSPPATPPVSSLLPPGTYPPTSIISQIFPSQRPLPPVEVYPAPAENLTKPKEEKPTNIIFTPGCSNANVAMSRHDAIRLLQQANLSN